MSITIHIQLMSGDVLNFTTRARGGKVKYMTVKEKMSSVVYEHLQLDPKNYRMEFAHEDDEKLLEEQWVAHVNKWAPRRGRVPTAQDYDFAHHSAMQPELAIQMKGYVDKERCYQDGAVVYAMVSEFNLRSAWAELGSS